MNRKQTRKKRKAAAVDPHPFNGRFRSARINPSVEESEDGEFDLEITPGGEFIRGTHTPRGGRPVPLTHRFLTPTTIRLEATSGRYWDGLMLPRLGGGRLKVVIGFYHIPGTLRSRGRGAPVRTGQDNGIWVSTQP